MALASKQNRVTGQKKQHNMWFKSQYHNDNPDFVDERNMKESKPRDTNQHLLVTFTMIKLMMQNTVAQSVNFLNVLSIGRYAKVNVEPWLEHVTKEIFKNSFIYLIKNLYNIL